MIKESCAKVLDKLDENNIIDTTRDLVRIPSVTGNEKARAEYVANRMKKLGLEVIFQEVLYDRPNVIGILRGSGGGKNLIYTAHIDTHPPVAGQVPWCGDVKNGAVYGLGTGDNLPSMACFLNVAEAIKKAEVKLKGDVVFVMDSDEYTRSRGLQRVIDWMRDNKISAEMCIMGEPTALDIGIAHTGIVEFEIEIKSEGGYLRGRRNAVLQMMKVIEALEKMAAEHKFFKEKHPLIGSPIFYVGPIEGGARYLGSSSIRAESGSLRRGMRSWQAFNIPNAGAMAFICPEFCKLRVGVRTLPRLRRSGERWSIGPRDGMNTEEVTKLLRNAIEALTETNQIDYTLSVIQDRNLPVELSPDEPVVEVLKKVAKEASGTEPRTVGFPYWVEGTMLLDQLSIPHAQYGPPDYRVDFNKKEHCKIENILKAAKVYASVALEVCSLA